MAEEKTQADGTGAQAKEQAVTAEQLDELKRQLEETKKAQSGSDKRVQELTRMLEEKEREVETTKKSSEEQMNEKLAEIEKKLAAAEKEKQFASQKSVALEMLQAEGLKAPKFLSRLVGEDEEVTRELVSEYIADKKQTEQDKELEFAKKNGRKVTDATMNMYDGLTYEELAGMSNDEFAKVPKQVVDKIMKTGE